MKTPLSFSIGLYLILLNALFLAGFGALTAAGLHPALPDSAAYRWVQAALAFGAAVVLGVLYAGLRKHARATFYPAVALLLLMAFSLIFDQFGLADLAALAAVLLPAALLWKNRAWYFA